MKKIIVTLASSLLCACSASVAEKPSEQSPELKKLATNQAMVVTANPHATQAGLDVLKAGGSAVDAAMAIQAVLSLVEPQSSGLGGGGFMTYFDATSKALSIYDGRETAPSKAHADMFLDDQQQRLPFLKAKHSGLSIGVPGVVSMFELAHADHGQLTWGTQFQHAKSLAVNGFKVSPRLNSLISRFGKFLPKSIDQGPVDAFHYLHNDQGQPLPVGTVIKNQAYADTLDIIADSPRAFYQGVVAQQIVDQVAQAPRQGSLSLEDIRAHKAQKRTALCIDYRENSVCGPQAPSSWVTVGQILGLLTYAPSFSSDGADDPLNWSLFAEAQRLAYVDRDRFVADDNFVEVPNSGMLNTRYLKERAALISNKQASPSVSAGEPWKYNTNDKTADAFGTDATLDIAGTTHFVVVDQQGNVVSMTSSVESVFGSGRMAGGMFLNNQLTDFSFNAKDKQGRLIANRVEPSKRPRSSMSPTIVLDKNGDFLMATGSPGGSSIIAYNAKTIVGVLDWGLSPQQAVDLPNMVARRGKVRIEKSRASQSLIDGLKAYGHNVHESAGENSGFSMVLRKANGELVGGVDTRREGTIGVIK